MRSNGHPHLWTESCGFDSSPHKVDLEHPQVIDPSVEKKKGILEIKCPFSKKTIQITIRYNCNFT